MTSPFLLLMPSYNQAHFIAESVESVLAQDDPNWELWILDNSSDETPKVMERFTDPRIHFIHEPRRMDPGTCLNELLAMAKGEHFSYIHTDNRLLPDYVRLSREALSRHPLAVAVCDYWEISEAGKRLKVRKRPDPFPLRRLFSIDTIGVPFSATTELARQLGGFSASDLADDVLFVLRADPLGPRIHIKTPIMEYRVHGGSRFLSSGGDRVRQAVHKSILKAFQERPAGSPDPFQGMEARVRDHVRKASGLARILAKGLLKGRPPEAPIWIEGEGPAAFWLAWALAELGQMPSGFLGREGFFLGLPCRTDAPAGAFKVNPRVRGAGAIGLSLRWLLSGLPVQDHRLKRPQGDLMASLLVPFQAQHPGIASVSIAGEGPLAAYAAFGAEVLAGLKVIPGVENRPWPWMKPSDEQADSLWDLRRS